ncbi:hypothetical protein MRX96_011648 [Rhipicephalus microplus]
MPRLPSEHYKIVIRPRHPINLSNIGLATLVEAIQNTAKVDPARAEEEDPIRIHPIKNTLTISAPGRIRAEAYHSLEVLKSQRYNMNFPVATYVPAPDDSIRGVVYEAYTDETDHDLQAQLMKKNPDIPIVNARGLGSSKQLVITFTGHKLPATIRFRGQAVTSSLRTVILESSVSEWVSPGSLEFMVAPLPSLCHATRPYRSHKLWTASASTAFREQSLFIGVSFEP